MKKQYKNLISATLIVFTLLCSSISYADAPPPPPPPGGGHGQGGNHGPGGGAPAGEGILVLSILGMAYGAKKLIAARKEGTGPNF